jgi:hypothetical protein
LEAVMGSMGISRRYGPAVTLETDSYDGSSLTDRTGITAHDSAYTTLNLLRGNRTTTIQPGSTRRVSYDIGGMSVSADDGRGHNIAINPASGTNFAAPGAPARPPAGRESISPTRIPPPATAAGSRPGESLRDEVCWVLRHGSFVGWRGLQRFSPFSSLSPASTWRIRNHLISDFNKIHSHYLIVT